MVHLNITLDEKLYKRLKARAPAKKMSAFIAEALMKTLGPSKQELEEAYQAAARETWRRGEAEAWTSIEVDGWPE